ncbi:MAG: hypothetical protein ACYTBZ_21830, partial [Planctomycetota bacterium]
GDLIVVGAERHDVDESAPGAAYVYRFNGSNWVEEAKLLPWDVLHNYFFGKSVAISGNTIVVGAVWDWMRGRGVGSAYVFTLDPLAGTWSQEAKLLSSDGAEEDYFGNSVAIVGNIVMVGARDDDDNNTDSGSVYVFDLPQATGDEDGDGLSAQCDNCPQHYNPNQIDCDVDGIGDVCGLADGINTDNNSNGIMDQCELRCSINEVDVLLASDGAANDHFGDTLAISGETVIIGSRADDDFGTSSGAAYIYRYDSGLPSGWSQEAKLLASDGAEYDLFGRSVVLIGEQVMVGASGDDDKGASSGSVYVFAFDGSTWIEETKLLASDGSNGDEFGHVIAASADVVVIGAHKDDDNGYDSGSAYVFRYDGANWAQEAKLLASDGAADDWFGYSVVISDDVIVVGAYADDDMGSYSGSAYVYRFDGSLWVEEAKLIASDGAYSDRFGYSVGISGDTVIIGASGDRDKGSGSGSAYIFRFNGLSWEEEAKLRASEGSSLDNFGRSVAIDIDIAVIGAYQDDDLANRAGSAYFFRYDGSSWNEQAKLLGSNTMEEDYFGTAVSVSGNVAVIGARYGDGNEADSGSAYVFDLPSIADSADDDLDVICGMYDNCPLHFNPDQADCDGEGIGDVCAIAEGLSKDCNLNNIPDDCETDTDGDGVPDSCDLCPTEDAGELDVNGDGCMDSLEDIGEEMEGRVAEQLNEAIEEIISDPDIADKTAEDIQHALDEVIGKQGGKANSGAADKLQDGDLVAALTKINKAVDDLLDAAQEGYDTTQLQELLTDFARLSVMAAIQEAEQLFGSTDPDVLAARNFFEEGNALFEVGELLGALARFKAAAQALP